MDVQITEQPKCNKGGTGGSLKQPSRFERVRRSSLKFVKSFLVFVLMRPAFWRLMMVHVPEFSDRINHFLKDVYSFFADLL